MATPTETPQNSSKLVGVRLSNASADEVKGEREREREKNEKWKSCVASLVTFADPPDLKGLGWTKGKFCWIREFDVQVSILEKYGHVKCSHKFINCSIKKKEGCLGNVCDGWSSPKGVAKNKSLHSLESSNAALCASLWQKNEKHNASVCIFAKHGRLSMFSWGGSG